MQSVITGGPIARLYSNSTLSFTWRNPALFEILLQAYVCTSNNYRDDGSRPPTKSYPFTVSHRRACFFFFRVMRAVRTTQNIGCVACIPALWYTIEPLRFPFFSHSLSMKHSSTVVVLIWRGLPLALRARSCRDEMTCCRRPLNKLNNQ